MISRRINFILVLFLVIFSSMNSVKASFYNKDYADYVYYIVLTSSVSVQVSHTYLCVYGNKKEYGFFNSINGKKLRNEGNFLQVIFLNKVIPKDIKNCNAIYIPHKFTEEGKKIIDIVKKEPILTIGEKDFAWKGGVMSLYWRSKKIQFTINLEAMKEAMIQINPQILQMAHLIEEHTE